jgi:hypothetical protein
MKKYLLLLVSAIFVTLYIYSQTNTFAVQDSSTMTVQRWRDTCFAVLDLSASAIGKIAFDSGS